MSSGESASQHDVPDIPVSGAAKRPRAFDTADEPAAKRKSALQSGNVLAAASAVKITEPVVTHARTPQERSAKRRAGHPVGSSQSNDLGAGRRLPVAYSSNDLKEQWEILGKNILASTYHAFTGREPETRGLDEGLDYVDQHRLRNGGLPREHGESRSALVAQLHDDLHKKYALHQEGQQFQSKLDFLTAALEHARKTLGQTPHGIQKDKRPAEAEQAADLRQREASLAEREEALRLRVLAIDERERAVEAREAAVDIFLNTTKEFVERTKRVT